MVVEKVRNALEMRGKKMKKLICEREKYNVVRVEREKMSGNFVTLFTNVFIDKFCPSINEICITNECTNKFTNEMYLLVLTEGFIDRFYLLVSTICITDIF